MSGKIIGYIRVSTYEQNGDLQLDGLKTDRTYTDKASGRDANRPELVALLDYVRDGDIVKVHSIDRLARNLDDLRKIVKTIIQKGVRIEFIKESLMFTGEDSPMAILLLSVMGAFTEFERSLIRERQREGVAIAKAKGLYRGRKPKLSSAQIEEAKTKIALGVSKARVAREMGITRMTLYSSIGK